jgi:peptidoglycan-N-acetylglucosamine deacetylase
MDLSFLERPKTPRWLMWLLLLLTWHRSRNERSVYLTFDDGPTPDVTEPLLDVLQRFDAKATFFCVGQQIEHGQATIERIQREGHTLGNHTYSHRSGWRSSFREYLQDIERCDRLLPSLMNGKRHLFRPPYGQLGVVQGLYLICQRPIIYWDVNSMDYQPNATVEAITQRVLDHVRPGSIVLMHDSQEAGPKTIKALTKIIEGLHSRGLKCKAL